MAGVVIEDGFVLVIHCHVGAPVGCAVHEVVLGHEQWSAYYGCLIKHAEKLLVVFGVVGVLGGGLVDIAA